MSEKQAKKLRQEAKANKEVGKVLAERAELLAANAALKAKLQRSEFDLHQTRIELGVTRAAIAVVLNNQRQPRAFFSKRALDKARSSVTVTVKVAKEVIGPEERAVLVAGELKFQEQKKRSESRLVLPEGVEGIEDLYTPEARAEAEAWVDLGVVVLVAPKPVSDQNGRVHYQDPSSSSATLPPSLNPIIFDRG